MDPCAEPSDPRPIIITVVGVAPAAGRTPWWTRAIRPDWSHVVIAVAGVIWDQPFKGAGTPYEANSWLRAACREGRDVVCVGLDFDDHDPLAYLEAARLIETRKGQPIRAVLRYLKLWPKAAWNCTSPTRVLLQALGIVVTGETPDAIIQQCIEHANDRDEGSRLIGAGA